MPDVASHPLAVTREVAFELDRFELADDQLELAGRWFGVQGRRFMRPSLTLGGVDGETRLLADLVHKPWTAENGELWRAAFPCDGELGSQEEAELTVAPDLTVALAVPGAVPSRRRNPGGARRQDAPPRRDTTPVIRDRRQDAAQTQALSSARAEIAALRERLEELGSELEHQRARFARELREAEESTAEQALAVRRKARKAAERALAERDDALVRLDKAVAERDKALAERDKALAHRAKALRQRGQAVAERHEASAQRDQAVKDFKRFRAERDELAGINERLRNQGERAVATPTAPPVMPGVAIESSEEGRPAHWLPVAIAVTSLLMAALAVILILSSS